MGAEAEREYQQERGACDACLPLVDEAEIERQATLEHGADASEDSEEDSATSCTCTESSEDCTEDLRHGTRGEGAVKTAAIADVAYKRARLHAIAEGTNLP